MAEPDAGFSDTGWDHGPARLPLDVVAAPPGFCACCVRTDPQPGDCPRCGHQLTEACQSGSGPDHFGGTP